MEFSKAIGYHSEHGAFIRFMDALGYKRLFDYTSPPIDRFRFGAVLNSDKHSFEDNEAMVELWVEYMEQVN